MTNKANVNSVEKDTIGSGCVYNTTDYRQRALFVREKEINGPDISFYDASLLPATSMRTSVSTYGFDYSCGTDSLPFLSQGIFTKETTPSKSGIIFFQEDPDDSLEGQLVDRPHNLEPS